MIIQHNIMALNAHRQLSGNNGLVSKNLEKLSSGYRINRAGDDAAGLAISEKMRSQIKGLERAQSNAQDGISLVQTAEGALTEVHSMLNRLVDLGTESANGTIQESDRNKIQDEVDALTAEIDRISEATNFNGIKLLNGSLGSGSTSSTTGGADKILLTQTAADGTVTVANVATTAGNKAKDTVTIGATAAAVGDEHTLKVDFILNGEAHSVTFKATEPAGTPSATTAATAIFGDADAIKQLDALGIKVANDAAGKISFELKEAGKTDFKVYSVEHKLKGTTAGTAATVTNTTAGTDATMAMAGGDTIGTKVQFEVDGKKFQIVKTGEKADAGFNALYTDTGAMADVDATKSVAAQLKDKYNIEATAHATTAGTLTFKKGTTTTSSGGTGTGLTLQIGDTADEFNKVTVSVGDMSSKGLGIDGIKVTAQGLSADAITEVNKAVELVSTARGQLGALQNRLEHTINNLGVTTENMTAAESRIRDVDMAKEMMHFTKNNVLTQAAQAMLAQANQQPQQVLQLLR